MKIYFNLDFQVSSFFSEYHADIVDENKCNFLMQNLIVNPLAPI